MGGHPLAIGSLARSSGVRIDTIRYYERLGLLRRAKRTASGHRRFDPDALERLRFIRHAQELGFTLADIGDLLDLRVRNGSSCEEVRARAAERLAEIERKLGRLRRIRTALRGLITDCDSSRATSECPILVALGREEHDETRH